MTMQQPDRHEYSHVMNFVNSNPHRVNELPETCYCLCNKNHARDWMWNLGFLIKHNKLHLVTEFRVVIYNKCELPMHIDKLRSSLPNVRSILFLGYGDVEPRQELIAAESAAESIRKLFPCNWGPTPNILVERQRICTLYECTLKEYIHQLKHVQVLIPFPLNVAKLIDNLTSLSINIPYIRLRHDCQLFNSMFQIEAVIPWHFFEITEGALSFNNLESLHLEFIQVAARTVDFPGCNYPVYFPRLSALNITGSAYVYTDIYAYFHGRVFERLTIMDDPTNFEHINEHAFESVRMLKIGHPTRTPFVDVYSVDMVERLYQLPSSVEEAVLGLLDYPLPELIAWVNLRSLKLSASIAGQARACQSAGTTATSAHTHQRCGYTRFPDQKITFDEIGEVLDPSSQLPVSESLERLDLFVRGTFDLVGFCELVLRLPRVTKSGPTTT
ncbi:hypothetical protein DL89DRAFT_273326 [Linderina pennispora]|uniref:F-box domain-containing protein n=1 Tax=Linderina pennispora TaxID=61395 RepID=A0A1Y1VRV0_9FUNG|nr:uncharacterized protein DL89DRAFT_273326 [Linderina pennispora]ORX63494.1 hypothetical protein DL89DRAFT_273326 [Linderina pennispora]